MKLAVLLHFYQPYNQQDDILMRIVNECYLPLTRGLLAHPDAKLTANVNGALLELLDKKGYKEVIENLKKLLKRGQIELTGSAMYHAFLPLLPESEIIRQIDLNFDTTKKYFGDTYQPVGFFSPEMATNEKIFKIIADKGYKWATAPQLSYPNGNPSFNKIYKLVDTDVSVVFREKRISSLMLSGVCRTGDDFIRQTEDLQQTDSFWVSIMDAETFGHHRIGHENFLFDLLGHEKIEATLIKDLVTVKNPGETEYVNLRPSTWTNEEQDFWLDKNFQISTTDKSFILWKDPENPIHKLQWELTNYSIDLVNSFKDKTSSNYLAAREMLDKAISSDQYWWASAKPWWSLEMIEQGAYELKTVVSTLNVDPVSVKKADDLYRLILDQAFDWQRSGYIRKKHLENSSTFMKQPFKERTPSEWYNQMILEFEDQMNTAGKNREFEKAIKWRDALIKLKQGTDIFDVLHVVDELWSARSIPLIKPFFDHTWEEFSEFAKNNFIDVPTKEAFEKWKKDKKRVESK